MNQSSLPERRLRLSHFTKPAFPVGISTQSTFASFCPSFVACAFVRSASRLFPCQLKTNPNSLSHAPTRYNFISNSTSHERLKTKQAGQRKLGAGLNPAPKT